MKIDFNEAPRSFKRPIITDRVNLSPNEKGSATVRSPLKAGAKIEYTGEIGKIFEVELSEKYAAVIHIHDSEKPVVGAYPIILKNATVRERKRASLLMSIDAGSNKVVSDFRLKLKDIEDEDFDVLNMKNLYTPSVERPSEPLRAPLMIDGPQAVPTELKLKNVDSSHYPTYLAKVNALNLGDTGRTLTISIIDRSSSKTILTEAVEYGWTRHNVPKAVPINENYLQFQFDGTGIVFHEKQGEPLKKIKFSLLEVLEFLSAKASSSASHLFSVDDYSPIEAAGICPIHMDTEGVKANDIHEAPTGGYTGFVFSTDVALIINLPLMVGDNQLDASGYNKLRNRARGPRVNRTFSYALLEAVELAISVHADLNRNTGFTVAIPQDVFLNYNGLYYVRVLAIKPPKYAPKSVGPMLTKHSSKVEITREVEAGLEEEIAKISRGEQSQKYLRDCLYNGINDVEVFWKNWFTKKNMTYKHNDSMYSIATFLKYFKHRTSPFCFSHRTTDLAHSEVSWLVYLNKRQGMNISKQLFGNPALSNSRGFSNTSESIASQIDKSESLGKRLNVLRRFNSPFLNIDMNFVKDIPLKSKGKLSASGFSDSGIIKGVNIGYKEFETDVTAAKGYNIEQKPVPNINLNKIKIKGSRDYGNCGTCLSPGVVTSAFNSIGYRGNFSADPNGSTDWDTWHYVSPLLTYAYTDNISVGEDVMPNLSYCGITQDAINEMPHVERALGTEVITFRKSSKNVEIEKHNCKILYSEINEFDHPFLPHTCGKGGLISIVSQKGINSSIGAQTAESVIIGSLEPLISDTSNARLFLSRQYAKARHPNEAFSGAIAPPMSYLRNTDHIHSSLEATLALFSKFRVNSYMPAEPHACCIDSQGIILVGDERSFASVTYFKTKGKTVRTGGSTGILGQGMALSVIRVLNTDTYIVAYSQCLVELAVRNSAGTYYIKSRIITERAIAPVAPAANRQFAFFVALNMKSIIATGYDNKHKMYLTRIIDVSFLTGNRISSILIRRTHRDSLFIETKSGELWILNISTSNEDRLTWSSYQFGNLTNGTKLRGVLKSDIGVNFLTTSKLTVEEELVEILREKPKAGVRSQIEIEEFSENEEVMIERPAKAPPALSSEIYTPEELFALFQSRLYKIAHTKPIKSGDKLEFNKEECFQRLGRYFPDIEKTEIEWILDASNIPNKEREIIRVFLLARYLRFEKQDIDSYAGYKAVLPKDSVEPFSQLPFILQNNLKKINYAYMRNHGPLADICNKIFMHVISDISFFITSNLTSTVDRALKSHILDVLRIRDKYGANIINVISKSINLNYEKDFEKTSANRALNFNGTLRYLTSLGCGDIIIGMEKKRAAHNKAEFSLENVTKFGLDYFNTFKTAQETNELLKRAVLLEFEGAKHKLFTPLKINAVQLVTVQRLMQLGVLFSSNAIDLAIEYYSKIFMAIHDRHEELLAPIKKGSSRVIEFANLDIGLASASGGKENIIEEMPPVSFKITPMVKGKGDNVPKYISVEGHFNGQDMANIFTIHTPESSTLMRGTVNRFDLGNKESCLIAIPPSNSNIIRFEANITVNLDHDEPMTLDKIEFVSNSNEKYE